MTITIRLFRFLNGIGVQNMYH